MRAPIAAVQGGRRRGTSGLAPERGAVLVAATNAANDDAALVVDEAFGPMVDRFLP